MQSGPQQQAHPPGYVLWISETLFWWHVKQLVPLQLPQQKQSGLNRLYHQQPIPCLKNFSAVMPQKKRTNRALKSSNGRQR